ncbi:MAG: thiamine pyrophosphate-binding protein [Okeania sp. SIO3I5]|nr:thiamine pyrophosphate-binding protein [Okeania sp. SIO3I5]
MDTTVVTESQQQNQQETFQGISVAQQIVALLEQMGVKLAFGVSGGAIGPVWGALEASSIDVLHCRHEGGATFAATEAHFASDRPVAAFATTGPGLMNALTGLSAARWEGAKVIFLSAYTPASLWGHGACQETSPYTTPLDGLFTAGTLFDYAMIVKSASQLPDIALQLLKGIKQREGFVAHISIPTDIQKSECSSNFSLPKLDKFYQPRVTLKNKKYQKYAELLCQKRSAIWVGFEARRAAKEIVLLAEKIGCPVICSPRGKGIFPETHSQFAGVVGMGGHTSALAYMNEYMPETILVLGTNLSEFSSFWNQKMLPSEDFIHVGLNSHADSAYSDSSLCREIAIHSIHSDVKTVVKKLLKKVEQCPKQIPPRPQSQPIEPHTNDLVRPGVLMEKIQKLIVEGSDAVVMAEPGNSFAWTTNMLRFSTPNRYRTSTGFAAMGHVVTGVVGATVGKLKANAAKKVKAVAIVGDGSMLMNCEISTAVQYQIPAVWIVLNDACYNMVDQVLPHLKCKELVQIPQTDFVQIACAMGADGITVETESEIEKALEKALAAEGPFVVDVRIDPTQKAPTESRMMSLKNQVA